MIWRALIEEFASALESNPALAARLRTAIGLGTLGGEEDLLKLSACGVPVRTLRKAIRAGSLPASKVGRDYLVSRKDLAAWLSSTPVAPRPVAAKPHAAQTAAQRAIERARNEGGLRAISGGAK